MEGFDLTQQVVSDPYVARRIPDTFEWGSGFIGRDADQSNEAQVARVELAMHNIVRVNPGDENGADCTDGRMPDVLLDNTLVPMRPKAAGASLVAAFTALEGVGEVPFTRSPEEAVLWTADTMRDANITPIAHAACYAAENYLETKENAVRFAGKEGFEQRQAQTMQINGVPYDQRIQNIITATHLRQLRRPERYTDLSLQTFIDVAQEVTGDRGVASYVNDGRGTGGHVESDVFWLYTPGETLDTRAYNIAGEQAFVQNGDVTANIAKRLAHVLRKLELEVPLRHALNTHANALHGSLVVPSTPTWLIKKQNGGR